MKNPHGIHWDFAAANAFATLHRLAYAFDFAGEVGSANFLGIKPDQFVEIIDGFLTENDITVPPGNRRDLEECRQLFVTKIRTAYDQGKVSGRSMWVNSPTLQDSFTGEILHQLANQSAPKEPMIRGWYMEAFCTEWMSQSFEKTKKDTGK